jgi:hypothetical protein
MSFAKVQPIDNHTFIFVSFPGIKMKMINALEGQRTDSKNRALCVQLDENGELCEFSFVPEAYRLKFSFEAKQTERTVFYQVIKLRHNSAGEAHREFVLTDTLSIVQRETDNAYEYVLIEKTTEKAELGRRKSKRRKSEKVKVTEHMLFIVMKTVEQEAIENSSKVIDQHKKRVELLRVKKKKYSFFRTEERVCSDMMRLQKMRSFEKNAMLVPALLRFLGPGDRLLPLSRAAPCA